METMEFLKEIKKAVANNEFYDWITTNYYKLDKEQLKEIILNLDYAIGICGCDSKEIEESMVEELIIREEA